MEELAEHRVAYDCPAVVVANAQGTCDEIVAALRAGLQPYDGTHLNWLTRLNRLTALA